MNQSFGTEGWRFSKSDSEAMKSSDISMRLTGISKLILASFLLGVLIYQTQHDLTWDDFARSVAKSAGGEPQSIEAVTLSAVIPMFYDPGVVFVDVRERRFYKLSAIPGALNIEINAPGPIDDNLMRRLKGASNVVIYCAGVFCTDAYKAANMLRSSGVSGVKVYPGGWSEWVNCRLPVFKPE